MLHRLLLVLVAEDELLQRMDPVRELQSAGCDVIEASSGEEAVGHLQDGRPIDLIVTDINLGGALSGWDVADSFRSVHPQILVVYVSASPAEPGRQVPDSVFLHKPWQPADLLNALPTG